jgi:hypothetical protein
MLSTQAYDAVSTRDFVVGSLFGPHQKLFHAKMFQFAISVNPTLAVHIDKHYKVLDVVAKFLRGDEYLFNENGFANLAGEVVRAESDILLKYLMPLLDGKHWYVHAVAFAYHDGHEDFAGKVGRLYGEQQFSRGVAAALDELNKK